MKFLKNYLKKTLSKSSLITPSTSAHSDHNQVRRSPSMPMTSSSSIPNVKGSKQPRSNSSRRHLKLSDTHSFVEFSSQSSTTGAEKNREDGKYDPQYDDEYVEEDVPTSSQSHYPSSYVIPMHTLDKLPSPPTIHASSTASTKSILYSTGAGLHPSPQDLQRVGHQNHLPQRQQLASPQPSLYPSSTSSHFRATPSVQVHPTPANNGPNVSSHRSRSLSRPHSRFPYQSSANGNLSTPDLRSHPDFMLEPTAQRPIIRQASTPATQEQHKQKSKHRHRRKHEHRHYHHHHYHSYPQVDAAVQLAPNPNLPPTYIWSSYHPGSDVTVVYGLEPGQRLRLHSTPAQYSSVNVVNYELGYSGYPQPIQPQATTVFGSLGDGRAVTAQCR